MMVPGGMRTSKGAKQPEFRGISTAIKTRRQYKMADFATAEGAFRLWYPSAPVPSKSKTAPPSSGSMIILTAMGYMVHVRYLCT